MYSTINIKSISEIFILLSLLIIPVRGLLIFIFDLQYNLLYQATFLLLILLGTYSTLKIFIYENLELNFFIKILKINFIMIGLMILFQSFFFF